MLQRQTIDIPVGFGLDENTGKPSVQAGKLMSATDFRIAKGGELETRTGFDAISRTAQDGTTGGAVSITSGSTAFSHGGALYVADNSSLYRYSPALSKLCRVDAYPEFNISGRTSAVHGGSRTTVNTYARSEFCAQGDDCAEAIYCDGCWVVVHNKDTQAIISVFDASTMARIGAYKSTDIRGRLLTSGTYVYWVTTSFGSGQATVYKFQPRQVSAGWLYGTSQIIGYNASNLDACLQGDHIVAVWNDTTQVKVVSIGTSDLSIVYTLSMPDRKSPRCICADANLIYLFSMEYNATTGATTEIMDALTPTLTKSTHTYPPYRPISCTAKPNLSGPIVGAMTYVDGSNIDIHADNPFLVLEYSDGAFITSSKTYHVQPISGVKIVDGKVYCALASEVRVYGYGESIHIVADYAPATAHLCEFPLQSNPDNEPYPARPVVRFAQNEVYYTSAYEYAPRRPPLADGPNGELALPVLMLGQTNGDYEPKPTVPMTREPSGIDLFFFKRGEPTSLKAIDVCGSPVCSGGVLTIPNRDSVSEIGFAWEPSISVAAQAIAIGDYNYGLTSSKNYLYCAVYAHMDDYGNIQRSAPSKPAMLETGTPESGQVYVGHVDYIAHTLTSKYRWERPLSDHVEWIEFYRTTANGTEFHFVGTAGMHPMIPGGTFGDYLTDTDAATCRTLYTDGGVLENAAPPCARAIARGASRLAVASADMPDTVWFSKQIIDGEIPGFNESLTSKIPDGPITALEYLGDCLIIFCEKSIWAINGQGPNDAGQGNDLTEPRLVSNALGCTDPRSVISYQNAVYFRAEQGIHRVDATLQVAFVGAPARDQLPSTATVTGACALPETQEILWSIATGPSTGTVLVYSVAFDQWLTWSPMDSTGVKGARFNGIADGAILRSNGELLVPNGAPMEADGVHRVSPSMTTAWLHLAGIQGFQRARQLSVLARGTSGASATIALAYDYADDTSWSRTWTAEQVTDATTEGNTTLAVHLPKQKCAAVRASIAFASADDAAPKVQGISLEVGVMPGQRRNGSAVRGSNPET